MLLAPISEFLAKFRHKPEAVTYVEVPAQYAHVDLASPFGRALISLASAVQAADAAGTPSAAISQLADCIDSLAPQTVTSGRPLLLSAALHEAAERMSGTGWLECPRFRAALEEDSSREG